ncbi:MAG: hypothetical protein A2W52_03920 [Candidatus Taylorbacteria bacterium RIFCSPHIGHO2_02_49_25]|uniref:Uncharacterized protein n=1 Tax=Candidatus Taylorbacteria bacterium RIFCSPHIGHO2_02_49_25 TaxID=1802305 RepID=A0A1G2ME33_9BACT|nr:MAG: hypothetical protein UY62_C0014G0019 [Parcubacteria group bacterium GW2011_GWF2_50_9]OHA22138.1 MAG: hypothetical protein A2W52_03920 [Candidatus Taylorbacteria bacterium RIFCSPHIGHO2_02_49_25]HCB35623.1 hypothetical protein [Candidatus Taylorbacteria bacterium]
MIYPEIQIQTARPSARLHHHFPGRKREVNKLLHVCVLAQLTGEQTQRLCGKLIREPQLLDEFLSAQNAGWVEAESFVTRHSLL